MDPVALSIPPELTIRVPSKLTVEIVLWAQFNGLELPVFVPIDSPPWAVLNACGLNVDRVVEQRGGCPVYGWRVRVVDGLWLEAEAHAIWRDEQGVLRDVSPAVDGERVSLFAADHSLLGRPGYDIIRPRFLNLCGRPEVDVLLDLMQRLSEFKRRPLNREQANAFIADLRQQIEIVAKLRRDDV